VLLMSMDITSEVFIISNGRKLNIIDAGNSSGMIFISSLMKIRLLIQNLLVLGVDAQILYKVRSRLK
jgi:hypothetical protein